LPELTDKQTDGLRACDNKRTACVNINNDLTVQYLQQAGTQSGGCCDMRLSMIITDCRLSWKRIIWWNVYDDMCRMGSWSFWSWFVVNQSIHCWRICAKKTIFTFSFQWPWSLTFRPQIRSP